MRLGLSLLPLRQISDNLITYRLFLSDSTPLPQIIKRSQNKLLTCYKVAKDTNTPSYYAIHRSNQTWFTSYRAYQERCVNRYPSCWRYKTYPTSSLSLDALAGTRCYNLKAREEPNISHWSFVGWLLALCVLMRKVAGTVSCRPRESGGNEIVLPDWNH